MMPVLVAAASVAAFNLVCTFTVDGDASSQEIAREWIGKPIFDTYRVDLTRRRFCDGPCASTRPIFLVKPDWLFLEGTNAMGIFQPTISINRESGIYRREATIYPEQSTNLNDGLQLPQTITFVGSCRRSAFSGFPARKF